MSTLPLTKQNLKQFMKEYSTKMESKQQRARSPAPSQVSFASTRSKRSRSQPNHRKSGHSRRVVSMKKTHLIKSHVAKIRPLVQKLREHEKKSTLLKAGYFADQKDTKVSDEMKSLQSQIDMLKQEIDFATKTIKAGLGNTPIKLRLTGELLITTTVTTGVTANVTVGTGGTLGNVDPSTMDEWTYISNLFDEYKVLGGDVTFGYMNPNPTDPTSGYSLDGLRSNALPIMAYDPESTALATSTLLTAQLAQHKFFPITFTNVDQHPQHVLNYFKFHVPRGDLSVDVTSSNRVAGTEWCAVVNPCNHGYLKFYHKGNTVVAKNTGAGVVALHCEFRCRA